MFARVTAILLASYFLFVTGAPTRAGETFSWQEAYAKVLPRGDLEWTPMPFHFEKGASLRYIDFDAGNDENDGTTNQAPWKHHPWDSQATGKAKVCRGIHTEIFKGAVEHALQGPRGDILC